MFDKKPMLTRATTTFSLVTSILVFGGCGGDPAGGLSTSQSEQSSIADSAKNLEDLTQAVKKFYDNKERFPGACSVSEDGKPLLSWRVHLLPYLDQKDLYDQFHLDESWDSDHNKKLLDQMPDVFRAPASKADKNKTVYRGIGGPFAGLFRIPSKPGTLTGIKRSSVLDGTSNTIMIIETSDALATEWTRPAILAPGNFETSELFGSHPNGTNAAFGDHSVKFVSDAISPKLFGLLFHRNDSHDLRNLPELVEGLESLRHAKPEKYRALCEKEAAELKKSFEKSRFKEIDELRNIFVAKQLKATPYQPTKKAEAEKKVLEQAILRAEAGVAAAKEKLKEGPTDEYRVKWSELEQAKKKLQDFKNRESTNRFKAARAVVDEEFAPAWESFYD